MSWASAVLALLKIISMILDTVQKNKWMSEGEDRQIARATADLFKKTELARKTEERINEMDEKEVDAVLVGFERPRAANYMHSQRGDG